MPRYLFRPMSDEDAREISGWCYEPPYDRTSDPKDLEELLDPECRKDACFSGLDEEGALSGFFGIEAEDETVDVGLGSDPTGAGRGLDFLLAGPQFARERHFRRRKVYAHRTNGGEASLATTRKA